MELRGLEILAGPYGAITPNASAIRIVRPQDVDDWPPEVTVPVDQSDRAADVSRYVSQLSPGRLPARPPGRAVRPAAHDHRVGAVTRSSAGPTRCGRPLRETTAATRSGRSAAAIRAATAPVLAPKSSGRLADRPRETSPQPNNGRSQGWDLLLRSSSVPWLLGLLAVVVTRWLWG